VRKPNPRDFLEDILENIQDIEEFIAGLSFEQFAVDKKTVKATLRSLEVIGEAVKNVPQDLLDTHPQIPWRSIARMRDKLIHHYFGVDLDVVWESATNGIDPLKSAVVDILSGLTE
jgi:uncharacterized protein with HEPN domain